MKTLTTLLFGLMLPFISFSQNGNIFAEVDGDYVTLWQTETWRNCGSEYVMHVDGDGYQVNWLQEDVGQAAYCMCYFDLSVTIGPLESGTYYVDVYSLESYNPDTIHQGSTQFTIQGVSKMDGFVIIDEYQSDCYNITSLSFNDAEVVTLKIYPNPADNIAVFQCNINHIGKLQIFNSVGQIVKRITDIKPGKSTLTWNLNSNDQDIDPGYYYVMLQTESGTLIKKLIVF